MKTLALIIDKESGNSRDVAKFKKTSRRFQSYPIRKSFSWDVNYINNTNTTHSGRIYPLPGYNIYCFFPYRLIYTIIILYIN